MAVAISQTANPAGVAASSTIATYTGASIGTAAADRIVVVVVGTELAAANPSAATIDGIAMTAGTGGDVGAIQTNLFYKFWPTGTTAEIKVTFSAVSPSGLQNHIAIYKVTGASDTPYAVGGDSTTDAQDDLVTTGSSTIPASGGMLAVVACATDSTARAWTELAEDIDEDAGSFRFSTATSTTAGTATRTCTGANNEDVAMSWITLASGAPQQPPTVILATPIDTATGQSVTPALIFTGTDPNADEVEYEVQVDKWYNTSWSYRVKVTVLATKVDADLTDYPVYVDLANLPAGFHTNVNQTDARDIRVTTSDGKTEVPREVVFYTAASDTGELHFKGNVDSDTNTDFYIYYGNAGASDYAVDATYGRNNVWNSDYLAVFHFQEAVNNDANGYVDSSGSGKHGQGTSMAITAPAGKLAGKAAEFDGAADYITTARILTDTTYSIAAWCNIQSLNGSSGTPIYYQEAGGGTTGQEVGMIDEYPSAGIQTFFARSGGAGVATGNDVNWALDTWFYAGATFNGTAVTFYYNGGSGGSGTVTGGTPPDFNGRIAVWYDLADATRFTDGAFDELRIRDDVATATWISTEYNNQSSPSTFYSVGSEETLFSAPLLDILSSTDDDANWAGTGAPNPFPSGNAITYTIPAGSALTNNITYYWRVRASDPLGSNTWGAYPTAFSFTTLAGERRIFITHT